MQGFSKVILIGNLGRAPELRHTNSGKAVANFSVAINSGRGDNQTTEWIPVVAWEKNAEKCDRDLGRGSPVYVEGRWKSQIWEDSEGIKRYKVEVVAHKVILLGSARDRPGEQDDRRERPAEGLDGGADDDMPF